MTRELSGSSARRGLTDTHCHINHEDFDEDRAAAMERARAAGIERLLVVGYDLASSRSAVLLAQANDDVQAVIGVHPDAAAEWSESAARELSELAELNAGKIAAWGEIGLDYHWEDVPRDLQRGVFEHQLGAAQALGLAVVIHCRDAYDDVLELLALSHTSRAVLHCFVGSPEQARRALDMGLYFGVGGIATFKKSVELRALYADPAMPLDKLILETDAPYLAPQPWRGKRNEPAYLVAVAEMLAQIRGCGVAEIADQTSRNADALFGRMRHEDAVDG